MKAISFNDLKYIHGISRTIRTSFPLEKTNWHYNLSFRVHTFKFFFFTCPLFYVFSRYRQMCVLEFVSLVRGIRGFLGQRSLILYSKYTNFFFHTSRHWTSTPGLLTSVPRTNEPISYFLHFNIAQCCTYCDLYNMHTSYLHLNTPSLYH